MPTECCQWKSVFKVIIYSNCLAQSFLKKTALKIMEFMTAFLNILKSWDFGECGGKPYRLSDMPLMWYWQINKFTEIHFISASFSLIGQGSQKATVEWKSASKSACYYKCLPCRGLASVTCQCCFNSFKSHKSVFVFVSPWGIFTFFVVRESTCNMVKKMKFAKKAVM